MREFKPALIMICTFILCAALLAACTLPTRAEGAADTFAGIGAYLQRAVRNSHIPGLAVTIVNSDSILYSGCYGNCGSTEEPFILGSVSKSFTALCVMRLAEAGALDIDAQLSQYLPDAADGDKLTLRQLLNQTGGLDTYQTPSDYRVSRPQGEHIYSNINYDLLGQVIEAVSGQSYEDYVTENIFRPLGMEHSSASPEVITADLVPGYSNYFGFPVETPANYPGPDSWIQVPAGFISSCASDLGRYLQMYLRGGEGIVSPGSLDTMFFDNVYVEDDIPYWYGMGWNLINEPLRQPALRHSGLVENYASCIYLLPESGLGIAVLANTNDWFVTNDKMDRIGWSIALMLMGDEPDEIGKYEYLTEHLLLDIAYLAVLLSALLPIFRMGRFGRSAAANPTKTAILSALLHLLYPAALLLFPRVLTGTPLWVVRGFVPDLFAVLAVSSALLIACGTVKAIILASAFKSHPHPA